MRHKNYDLVLATLLAALTVGWALLPTRPPLVGIIFVLPLVFVLPGYTLVEILFHKKFSEELPSHGLLLQPRFRIDRPFDASDRIILSLGLSMALVIISGFLLNILPIGLEALSWAVFLGIQTAVFSFIAACLRHHVKVNKTKALRFHIATHEYVLFTLAFAVLFLAIIYSANSAANQPRPGFSQLWMLQSTQTDNGCAVSLGVRSFEPTSVTYRIVMTVNGTSLNTWPSVTLAPKQNWDQPISLVLGDAKSLYIELQLYRSDKPRILYRDVHLTLHSLRGRNAQQCGA